MVNYKSINQALMKSCEKESKRFNSAIERVSNVQRGKLLDTIRRNSETIFGRKYGFKGISSIEEFRAAVPITTYEDYEGFITQIAEGREKVLTTEKVLMLEPTSGSTSPSKFIPYTESLKKEFQAGIFPWLYDLYSNRPELLNGSFYWSITPASHKQEKTSGGIPIGFGDDGIYFTSEQQALISQISAVPFDIAKIQDIEEFREATINNLKQHPDLRFISVWNPTFLSMLLRSVNNPAKLWPNLSHISTWADGNAANYIPEVEKLFPNAEIQGKGLIATEGFVSVPLVGRSGSALAVNSHFFEFRNLDNLEDVRLAHEVEESKEYETILTTSGGLYRYNLEDIIEVVGFEKECPLIRFKGRKNNVSDLFGEKLNEFHVTKAIRQTLENYNIQPSFAMLAPEETGGLISYTLFLEKQEGSIPETISEDLDTKLQENYHYKYCRRLGQLEEPRVFLIDSDKEKTASDIYLDKSQKKGKKIGNVKPTTLSSIYGWSREFSGRFINKRR
tara:strand:- start:6760 stop:8274 length:1515 start_codon:yes stop_codon:yes gene_type:complete